MHLFVTIVLDGVGIGAQPDACNYGDTGADTLGHVLERQRPHLPNLTGLGLGRIRSLGSIQPSKNPEASWGRMMEVSAGKDSTTGHWELAGLVLSEPFPTYSDGFPEEVIRSFLDATGTGGVLGNRAESGTAIIEEFGAEHLRTGYPIVYTSADSVFQVAAHEDVLAAEDLYDMCRTVRNDVCVGEHGVGRVIARPFTGSPGAFRRLSEKRKDLACPPSGLTLQEALRDHGVRTISIGKVADLFGGIGFDVSYKTASNAEGIDRTVTEIQRFREPADGSEPKPTFIWTNLIDFDQEFGHRNDPAGFASALEAFDQALPDLLNTLPLGSRLLITADHGNDPTTPGTDHSREYVPLLYYGTAEVRDLGTRDSFADHAATVASFFDAPFAVDATSFESAPED